MADDPFPAWSEPATKGDVVRAMIWTQGLAVRLQVLTLAIRGGDPDRISAALDAMSKEFDDYNKVLEELGGRR